MCECLNLNLFTLCADLSELMCDRSWGRRKGCRKYSKKTMNVLKKQEHRLHPDPKMDLSSVLIACI